MRTKALVKLDHSPMLPRSGMPGNARVAREALNAVILWTLNLYLQSESIMHAQLRATRAGLKAIPQVQRRVRLPFTSTQV